MVGHDVDGGAAVHDPDMSGGMGHVVEVVPRPLAREAAADPRNLGDEPGAVFDGIDAERRERRMAPLAADGRPHGALALVSDHDGHARRLADEATLLAHGPAAEMLGEAPAADATDLLVVGEGEMDRPAERRRPHALDGRKAHGQEALHVASAAAVQPPVRLPQAEGIARPGLSVDRHHVGMAGQDEAGHVSGADRREHIGFLAGRIIDPLAPNPEALQIAPRPSRPAGGWSCGSSCRTAPASTGYRGPGPHPLIRPWHTTRGYGIRSGESIKPLFIRSIRLEWSLSSVRAFGAPR